MNGVADHVGDPVGGRPGLAGGTVALLGITSESPDIITPRIHIKMDRSNFRTD